ncbi:MAG: DUF6265 family protein [Pirellulaceae bacterium]
MNRFAFTQMCSIVLVTAMAMPLIAQESNSENTLKLADGAKSPPATVNDIAWIAGHWQGEAMGGQFEETWNPPMGGAVMGMFKFVQDDNVGFYELLTIVPHDDSIILRLKHFDQGMTGWEEKDKSVEFPLVRITESEANFEGLTFRRIDEDTMYIYVVVGEEGEKNQEVEFACNKVGVDQELSGSPAAGQNYADAILNVYAMDALLARQRDQLPHDSTLEIAVRSYVRGLDTIDFSECPDDFAKAYREHRDAWAASEEFFAQCDELHGEMHQLLDQIREAGGAKAEELEKHWGAIFDTWARVEAAAAVHGVNEGTVEPDESR